MSNLGLQRCLTGILKDVMWGCHLIPAEARAHGVKSTSLLTPEPHCPGTPHTWPGILDIPPHFLYLSLFIHRIEVAITHQGLAVWFKWANSWEAHIIMRIMSNYSISANYFSLIQTPSFFFDIYSRISPVFKFAPRWLLNTVNAHRGPPPH